MIILVVSLGTRDATGHIVLDHPNLDNYFQATRPEFLPAFLNSVRYAMLTTVLSILIGYPIAYWISRHGGRHKVLLLILVMLPFWTSYLIRTYAWMIILGDNGVINWGLESLGRHQRPDPDAQHRLLGDPGHDLRLPAVRDPAAVRLDRPDGPQPGRRRRATSTRTGARRSCT